MMHMKAGVTFLNIANIPSFVWQDIGKSRKTAARTRGHWGENQNLDLVTTKKQVYVLDQTQTAGH
jgi:hypothetical protein